MSSVDKSNSKFADSRRQELLPITPDIFEIVRDNIEKINFCKAAFSKMGIADVTSFHCGNHSNGLRRAGIVISSIPLNNGISASLIKSRDKSPISCDGGQFKSSNDFDNKGNPGKVLRDSNKSSKRP